MNIKISLGALYGFLLGLLVAGLALNLLTEIWPLESVRACFASPAAASETLLLSRY